MDLQGYTSYPTLEKLNVKLVKTSDGKKSISFNYESVPFGPYVVQTDAEVRAVIEVAKERAEEKENRFTRKIVIPTTASTTANTIIGAELTERIRKDFNNDQMRSRSGKKKRPYPKRSQIIKIDPVTKELILPNGQRKPNPSIVNDDVEDSKNKDKTAAQPGVESGKLTFELSPNEILFSVPDAIEPLEDSDSELENQSKKRKIPPTHETFEDSDDNKENSSTKVGKWEPWVLDVLDEDSDKEENGNVPKSLGQDMSENGNDVSVNDFFDNFENENRLKVRISKKPRHAELRSKWYKH